MQLVSTEVALNYHLDPTIVNDLYQTLGVDYADRIIAPTIPESVKRVLQSSGRNNRLLREEAKTTIGEVIRATLIQRGIISEQVFITDFHFSPDFVRSVEAKVVASQEVLREQNILEKVRIQALSREAEAVGIGSHTGPPRQEAKLKRLRQLPKNELKIQITSDGRLLIRGTVSSPLATGSAFPFIDISLLIQIV